MENTEEVCNFIEEYRALPALWNTKSAYYKNKSLKTKAYDKLLTTYKLLKPEATLDEMKRKISNLRTSYKRELKKVEDSTRSGAGADEIYVSNLWYFDALSFLKDIETPVAGRSNYSVDDADDVESIVIVSC